MIAYIYEALGFFRSVFSRNTPWLVFCMVVLGFIGAREMIGVFSFWRFWGVGKGVYHVLSPFFSFVFLVFGGTFILNGSLTED
jgi:hypothetical protein